MQNSNKYVKKYANPFDILHILHIYTFPDVTVSAGAARAAGGSRAITVTGPDERGVS